jgi:hypothetical protein
MKMLPKGISQILKSMEQSTTKHPMCNDCYSASASMTPFKGMKEQNVKREEMKPGDLPIRISYTRIHGTNHRQTH